VNSYSVYCFLMPVFYRSLSPPLFSFALCLPLFHPVDQVLNYMTCCTSWLPLTIPWFRKSHTKASSETNSSFQLEQQKKKKKNHRRFRSLCLSLSLSLSPSVSATGSDTRKAASVIALAMYLYLCICEIALLRNFQLEAVDLYKSVWENIRAVAQKRTS